MNLDLLIPKTQQEMINFGIVGMLGGIAMLTAIGVVALNSPIRSALALVTNFFCLAFIYFTLGAEQLGIMQIVVYTGAIMVLFLFVIMLLNLSADNPLNSKKDLKLPVGALLGVALLGVLSSQILPSLLTVKSPMAPDKSINGIGWGQPQAVAKTLFTGYVWPFEVISLLLMVGIVGAILLVRRRGTA